MTNKPMLSVEREVIEKALRDALTIRFDTDSHVTNLRALLDKPASVDLVECDACPTSGGCVSVCMKSPKPAAQHQGVPVYLVRDHGSCCWEEMSGESLELCQAQPAEYEVRKLYAEQPAPVAMMIPRKLNPESLYPDQSDCGWNDCIDEVCRLNGIKP